MKYHIQKHPFVTPDRRVIYKWIVTKGVYLLGTFSSWQNAIEAVKGWEKCDSRVQSSKQLQ